MAWALERRGEVMKAKGGYLIFKSAEAAEEAARHMVGATVVQVFDEDARKFTPWVGEQTH